MRETLEKIARGEISVEEGERLIRAGMVAEMEGLAKLDLAREFRKGVPEIILAEGKRSKDVCRIAMEALESLGRVIVSRADEAVAEMLRTTAPEGSRLEVYERARMVVLRDSGFAVEKNGGRVGILTAGTSDIPVAEEAEVVAREMGSEVFKEYDVGVAGIHRLLPSLRSMMERDVDVIVAVAGREGAMPSVVAGLVDVPVVGVPTSVGYGLGEKGVSALTAMLQACPLGIAVVNIDAGVAGGAVAALIAKRAAKGRRQ